MGGGWHHRSYHHGGGGCLQGLIVLILLFLFIGANMFSTGPLGTGGYSEEVFQDYADAQYAKAFGSSSAYEDNLLISVLVDEDHYSYYYIAWVGDHIATDINHMLGGDGTILGQAMESCINQASYKYSLDSNLAQVMEILTEEVEALGLETSFSCSEDHIQVESLLKNDSDLDMTEDTVNSALAAFTQKTGIPVVMVVEDMTDVFNRDMPVSVIALLVVLGLGAVFAIVMVVRAILRRRGGNEQQHPYHSFDDQY